MALATNNDSPCTNNVARETFWHHLPQPILGLSPMDGVTDAAFRLIVARQGKPDVSVTEFTSVLDVCRGPDHLLSSLLYHEDERPIVAQLYGKDPDLFYQAAHVVCELGFDGLDINMGCPSRTVASSGSGAGLIRTPALAHAVMRAARQGILDWAQGQTLAGVRLKPSRMELIQRMNHRRTGEGAGRRRMIPLSVKTRLGYDSIVVEEWISHLLEECPAVISVHGRTLQQMYRGDADWDAIARAAQLGQETSTLVFGNGDVGSVPDLIGRVRQSGVQGVLVGRATLGAPWFFRAKETARWWVHRADWPGRPSAGLPDIEPDLGERLGVMVEHARLFEALFGREHFPRMRKHLGWYCKGFPHAAAMRAQMVRVSSSEEVEQLVARYQSAGVVPDQPSLSDAIASPTFSCG